MDLCSVRHNMGESMFYKAMPAITMDDLPKHQTDLLQTLHETPIMLINGGESAGVLVHPQLWNDLIEKLESFQALITSLQMDEQEILDAQVAAIDEAAGIWSDARHPEMRTPEDVVEWVKALRSSWQIHEPSTATHLQ